ncbi:maltotransferase domain-containing protein [Rhodococcoides fascians]|uniref:maltotransferase domain-containing protein n=1 Tax=Rhodococcoides fascians TaxID=1828 RepID=UPI0024BBBBBB|nr:maltotransferase domain-containing protein [Rhodococcus fascians]MDJ0411186.1 DUF3416 domain-containing protein [Rhodococcus fascians]
MTGRLGIDNVLPDTTTGKYPAKAVVGETFPVSADVWREGHDAVAATLSVRGPGGKLERIPMTPGHEPDTFDAVFVPSRPGYWICRIEAWSDPISTWRHAVEAKLGVGQSAHELANDLEIGARLFLRAATGVPAESRQLLADVAAGLRDTDRPLPARVSSAFASSVTELLFQHPLRELVTRSRAVNVWVDRNLALNGAWYEFFPRSTGGWNEDGSPRHGTFATSIEQLPRIARMGFDIVYLPPIHPIGTINRKGPNNTLTPGPEDVGSPWAIGSKDGGHDAIHPELGTEDDFRAFVDASREHGLEVALDLALQAAPDHPWAATHSEWFTVLPDGTIAYAENPPKKYQDIYPINFDNDRRGIYEEVLRVVRYWISLGVKIFRVDNPHTKPPDFWEWLIAEVKKTDPDVLFLAEAFTRPVRMYGLAQRGFTQSYTYFTWRTAKWELTEFAEEHARRADDARPNLFVNTPDILHESLQHGGPGMFALRAALAATLAPTWGVYSGYELYEHQAVREGSEEYLDSEKYQLRPRDFEGALARGESLEPWITTLNSIRRAHPALQQLRNIHFHTIDNEALIGYSKFDPQTGDSVLAVINLNPFGAEEGTVHLDMPALGHDWQDTLTIKDEVSGIHYDWGHTNFVRLEPWTSVAHIFTLPHIPYPARIELAYRGNRK